MSNSCVRGQIQLPILSHTPHSTKEHSQDPQVPVPYRSTNWTHKSTFHIGTPILDPQVHIPHRNTHQDPQVHIPHRNTHTGPTSPRSTYIGTHIQEHKSTLHIGTHDCVGPTNPHSTYVGTRMQVGPTSPHSMHRNTQSRPTSHTQDPQVHLPQRNIHNRPKSMQLSLVDQLKKPQWSSQNKYVSLNDYTIVAT